MPNDINENNNKKHKNKINPIKTKYLSKIKKNKSQFPMNLFSYSSPVFFYNFSFVIYFSFTTCQTIKNPTKALI